MIQSMTGFASTTLNVSSPEGYQTHVLITLKTLNSRYFETVCKLPSILSHLETQFIKLLKEKLHRGNIFLTVTMSNQNMFQSKVEPSLPVVKSYIDALHSIQKEFSLSGDISIGDLLRLANNIFYIEQKECDASIEHALIQATTNLIDSLISSRSQEGIVLQQDIQQRHDIIQRAMQEIAVSAQKFLVTKKEEINLKITALEGESPELIAMRKNAFLAELDKIDIHEEIVRFNAHLNNLNKLFDDPNEQEKGRKIGFILQELGREINTLSAKCSDIHIGELAINIKVELEKIREQSQNIL